MVYPWSQPLRLARRRTLRSYAKRRVVKAVPVVFSRAARRNPVSYSKIRKELKFFDTAVSFGVDGTLEVPASGQWALIPQGDTSSSRDGRQALIKKIEFRGLLTGPSTVNLTSNPIVYMWVIQDTQANGAAAAAADVFSTTAAATTLRNLNNNKRFKILKKCMIAPAMVGHQYGTVVVSGSFAWPIEFFIPCNILMDWNSTTGAITEITQNNIFIVAGISGGNATLDDEYSITGQARLRFYSD